MRMRVLFVAWNQTQPSAVTKGVLRVLLLVKLDCWLPSVLMHHSLLSVPWNQTQPSAVTNGALLVFLPLIFCWNTACLPRPCRSAAEWNRVSTPSFPAEGGI